MSGLRKLVLWILCVYLGLCVLVFVFQRRLLYFPDSSRPAAPAGALGQDLETFETRAADGVRIEGWYWPGAEPTTLVIFHGNAGHRGHRLGWVQDLRQGLGVGICLFDYRGYGGSGGSPTEEGLYRDGEAVLDWLAERGVGPLVYLGQSLGSGVAVELALRRPPAGLVLQAGFRSAVEVGAATYPWLPVRLLLRDRYENEAKLERLTCPLLAIHGDRDRLIPPSHGAALVAAAPAGRARLVEIVGAGHEDIAEIGGERYLATLREFLAALPPR